MQKQTRSRFWMVMVDEEGVPRVKHYEEGVARNEAERLAKLTGKDVFVLCADSFVRYTPPIPPPEIKWACTIKK